MALNERTIVTLTIDIDHDSIVLRKPTTPDLQALAAAFDDGQLDAADNITPFDPVNLAGELPGVVRLVAVDADTGELHGGGTIHHHDPHRATIEIGYWLLPRARGRGLATRIARALAEHAFSIGVQRVTALVAVGNTDSDRVLERAGFTREGVLRSLPSGDRRIDKTIYSLLPGDNAVTSSPE